VRSPAQVWKPTPMGSTLEGLGGGREDSESMALASRRAGSRSVGWAPGPMKPRPPALEIATAKAGPDIMRIGAPTMRGVVVHG